MSFNEGYFFIFLLITYLVFWSLPQGFRRYWLLLTSYFCYGFGHWELIPLLASVSFIAYSSAILVNFNLAMIYKRLLLGASVILILAPLIYYKYWKFFIGNVNQVFSSNFNSYEVILPIGISFFTFQAASYVFDVYRGRMLVNKNLFDFFLFISFFPQLVAGPIERAPRLLHQLHKKFTYKSENFRTGIKIIFWGLFKKAVIADHLAKYVDSIYSNHNSFSGATLLIATMFFAFQIYCDFSGYSDMAIGLGKLFDIELMRNFNKPYFSKSVHEFWRCWHISLSTWFKDYVYLPLGGNKVSFIKWIRNILIVFLLSGLWHGANWTFIVWGLIHGLLLIGERIFVPIYRWLESKFLNSSAKILSLLSFVFTFVSINLSWIFFRANSLVSAFDILKKIIVESFNFEFLDVLIQESLVAGFNQSNFLLLLFLILFLISAELNQRDQVLPQCLVSENLLIRRSAEYILVLAIILLGYFGKSQFIYFQF